MGHFSACSERIRSVLRRMRRGLLWRAGDAELREEIETHRALRQARLEREGLAPDEADRASRRALGNMILAREDARDVWIAPWIEGVWQDLRYAARALRRNPAFTLPALIVLAVTMGLTTSLYATARSLLFTPWPVADASRVVRVSATSVFPSVTDGSSTVYAASPGEFRYLHGRVSSVDLVAQGLESWTLGSAPDPRSTRLVSGNASRWPWDEASAKRTIAPAARRQSWSSATPSGSRSSRAHGRSLERRCAWAACRSRSSASPIGRSST
jgi:hypothetical protein